MNLMQAYYRGSDAHRHVERQLGQTAAAATAALVGRATTGSGVPAGNQACRRRIRRAARRGTRQPRLRRRSARRGHLERCGDPVARGPRRCGGRSRRRARLPQSGSARRVGHVRRDPSGLGVRAERTRARLGALPVQARLAGRAAGDACRSLRAHDRAGRHEHRAHRRGRVRSGRVHRPDARDAAGARSARGATGRWPA